MAIKKFKTLYKKTNTGKIQQWRIEVHGTKIISESGQTDGKKVVSEDVIKAGKNIGRANETTPEEQAILEARSKWQKKLKSGYVKTIEDAEAGKTDKVITGGYVPMTAKSFDADEKHIVYPCAVQPKLDGQRCCVSGGGLYTRSRKKIKMVPHIEKALKKLGLDLTRLDGELYNHDYKDDFETIMSSVKREKELHPDHEKIQYHIYDINMAGSFEDRYETLRAIKMKVDGVDCLRVVETRIANNREELIEIYHEFLEEGYEGAMARNLNAVYEMKRSKHLQKLKLFQDAEFKVLDVLEGRGKYANNIGSFVCEINDERGVRTFKVKPEGNVKYWKKVYETGEWKNKMLTVKFQNYSNKNHVPRFPVGVKMRDWDDL